MSTIAKTAKSWPQRILVANMETKDQVMLLRWTRVVSRQACLWRLQRTIRRNSVRQPTAHFQPIRWGDCKFMLETMTAEACRRLLLFSLESSSNRFDFISRHTAGIMGR